MEQPRRVGRVRIGSTRAAAMPGSWVLAMTASLSVPGSIAEERRWQRRVQSRMTWLYLHWVISSGGSWPMTLQSASGYSGLVLIFQSESRSQRLTRMTAPLVGLFGTTLVSRSPVTERHGQPYREVPHRSESRGPERLQDREALVIQVEDLEPVLGVEEESGVFRPCAAHKKDIQGDAAIMGARAGGDFAWQNFAAWWPIPKSARIHPKIRLTVMAICKVVKVLKIVPSRTHITVRASAERAAGGVFRLKQTSPVEWRSLAQIDGCDVLVWDKTQVGVNPLPDICGKVHECRARKSRSRSPELNLRPSRTGEIVSDPVSVSKFHSEN